MTASKNIKKAEMILYPLTEINAMPTIIRIAINNNMVLENLILLKNALQSMLPPPGFYLTHSIQYMIHG
jgi:hypothetical protein